MQTIVWSEQEAQNVLYNTLTVATIAINALLFLIAIGQVLKRFT